MALAGVISDAMQPLEDFAYLCTGFENPFPGLAHYIPTTVFGKFTANNFWQESPKWSDERVEVIAGFTGRDPSDGRPGSPLEELGLLDSMRPEVQAALQRARGATVKRIRELLASLAKDWKQFSPYFLAFKHGGTVINREMANFVDDDVEEMTDETPRHNPSLAVFRRSLSNPIAADFNLNADEVKAAAYGSGKLAIEMTERLLASRLATLDALEFGADGQVIGIKPLHWPWTHWLREGDLDEATWKLVGPGPTINWITEDPD